MIHPEYKSNCCKVSVDFRYSYIPGEDTPYYFCPQCKGRLKGEEQKKIDQARRSNA